MREFRFVVIIAAAVLASSAMAVAQNAPAAGAQRGAAAGAQRGAAAAAEPPSAPAPPRDFWGMWTSGNEALLSTRIPALTPAGAAKIKEHIPDPFSATSTDPWKTCDPFGMPRMVNNQNGQLGFAQMPSRIILMIGFNRAWREIWMDGRTPPKNIGADDGPSTMYYGYSVGHWEGNNTLVIETVGMDERTWVDRRGYPHTGNAKVTERYTRTDFDHLSMTESVEDPEYYTAPFLLAKADYRFVRGQTDAKAPIPFTNETICIPSQNLEYMKLIGEPADIDSALGQGK